MAKPQPIKSRKPIQTPPRPGASRPEPPEHEGATEAQTGDRTGPAAGYDTEPAQVKDKGGVS